MMKFTINENEMSLTGGADLDTTSLSLFTHYGIKTVVEQLKNILYRGSCHRRVYSALIADSVRVYSTGYTTNKIGDKQFCEYECLRNVNNIPSGERYEMCSSIHAEQMALLDINYTNPFEQHVPKILFLMGKDMSLNKYMHDIHQTVRPCKICSRLIAYNESIKYVCCISSIIDTVDNGIVYNMDVLTRDDLFQIMEG